MDYYPRKKTFQVGSQVLSTNVLSKWELLFAQTLYYRISGKLYQAFARVWCTFALRINYGKEEMK